MIDIPKFSIDAGMLNYALDIEMEIGSIKIDFGGGQLVKKEDAIKLGEALEAAGKEITIQANNLDEWHKRIKK